MYLYYCEAHTLLWHWKKIRILRNFTLNLDNINAKLLFFSWIAHIKAVHNEI